MKATDVQTTERVIPDSIVRRAIEYLDSSTDYRECIPRQHPIEATSRRRTRHRRSDVNDFLLVFMPIFLVCIAILAIVYK